MAWKKLLTNPMQRVWLAIVCLAAIGGCSAVLGLDPLSFDDPVVSADGGNDAQNTTDSAPQTNDGQTNDNDAQVGDGAIADADGGALDGSADASDADIEDAPYDPDAAQCLFCDAGCITNACTTLLVADGGAVGPVAVDDQNVYWISSSGISRADKANGQNQVHFNAPSASPREVLIDGAHVYWMNGGAAVGLGNVQRLNIDGGTVNEIVTGLDAPRSLTIAAPYLFWGTSGVAAAKNVGVASKTWGDAGTFLVAGPNLNERCIHASPAFGGDVFFANAASLYRGYVADGGVELQFDVNGCAWVDDAFYWLQGSPDQLFRRASVGAPATVAAIFPSLTGTPNPADFGKTIIGADASSIYVLRAANSGRTQWVLSRAPKTGGVAVDMAGVPAMDRLAHDATFVYWPVASGNAIIRMPK